MICLPVTINDNQIILLLADSSTETIFIINQSFCPDLSETITAFKTFLGHKLSQASFGKTQWPQSVQDWDVKELKVNSPTLKDQILYQCLNLDKLSLGKAPEELTTLVDVHQVF